MVQIRDQNMQLCYNKKIAVLDGIFDCDQNK